MAAPKSFQNALDMLPHLAARAKERRTMTYTELGEKIGLPARYLGQTLGIVRDRILAVHGLPRLDALVVTKESGEAGHDFYDGGREGISDEDYHSMLEDERGRVYDFADWDATILSIQAHYGGEEYLKSRGLV